MCCRALFWLMAVLLGGVVARVFAAQAAGIGLALGALWLLFAAFTLCFFRDPTPTVPQDAGAIVAPAHGRVDLIDEVDEPEVMNGRCRRISIFLSVFDVHVQNAPVAGEIASVKHQSGQFLSALKTESAKYNENVLIGIESLEQPGERMAVRQIAGLIARRIVPWVGAGDTIARGQRLGLIQFGSRCNLYLPLTAQIRVKPGDRVVGGETVVATRGSAKHT